MTEKKETFKLPRSDCVFPCFDENGEAKGALKRSVLALANTNHRHRNDPYPIWKKKA